MLNEEKILGKSVQRRHDIIQGILDSDQDEVLAALSEDTTCANSVHGPSGMNALMLACVGNVPELAQVIIDNMESFDFRHTDLSGRDLMEVAVCTFNPRIGKLISDLYVNFAPSVANNGPAPE